MKNISRLSSIIATTTVGAIVLFLVYFSLPLLHQDSINTLLSSQWNPSHNQYGLLPMIVGTLAIAILASTIALINSISIALSIDALPRGRFKHLSYQVFMLFGSIPTVIYGFIGVLFVVPFVRNLWDGGSGMSILSAGIVLGFVVTPTMVLFFTDSFRSTPKEFSLISASLGGHTIQYQLYILLPYHIRSISVGLILGLARAMGDTMIALMIAGNSIQIPTAMTDSARTLTSHIALLFAGDFDSMAFRSIFLSGLILFGVSLLLLLSIRSIRSQYE